MRLLRPFLGLLALALLCLPAAAQVTVQPSAQKLDAATTVCPITYSSGAVPAVNVTSTATCTPPGGMFVYITGISFDVCTNGTGTAANQVTFTSTNLTGSPVWSFSIAATASICQHWQEPLSTPLKSTAAGTAVTIVSPAAAANNSYVTRVYAYYAP
jgi:hypothetical protein